jgi:hypothetical protein
MKRKKKGEKATISTIASTVKPGAQASTEIIIGESGSESKMPTNYIKANHFQAGDEISQSLTTTMIDHKNQDQRISTTAQVPQLPQKNKVIK